MSGENKTGGAAYPGLHPSKECRYSHQGMTLRDHFAGMAMQSILRDPDNLDTPEKVASASFVFADAMIKENENG